MYILLAQRLMLARVAIHEGETPQGVAGQPRSIVVHGSTTPRKSRAEQSTCWEILTMEDMIGAFCWRWCLSYNVQQTRAVGRNPGSARERGRL